uniref:Uncharacterized protein n=1 Tax=Ditylenchus dipsaci TaxID=166011 RepID=A0A915E3Y3_9BILA
MDNCAKFNRENKHFLTYGHRIRRIGLIVIKAAEREEAALNSSNWLFDYARNLSLLDEKDLAGMSDHITPLLSKIFIHSPPSKRLEPHP